jgi:hypothetical protein
MEDRVRPFRVLLQSFDSFGGRQYLELDFPAICLAVHLFHHWQHSGSGADHKPPALPNENASKRMCTSQFSNRFVGATVPHSGTRRNIGLRPLEANDLQEARLRESTPRKKWSE